MRSATGKILRRPSRKKAGLPSFPGCFHVACRHPPFCFIILPCSLGTRLGGGTSSIVKSITPPLYLAVGTSAVPVKNVNKFLPVSVRKIRGETGAKSAGLVGCPKTEMKSKNDDCRRLKGRRTRRDFGGRG
ncbi:MAG TPA: hypothetical protein VF607_02460 [Verrucomicrobiae bacterium]